MTSPGLLVLFGLVAVVAGQGCMVPFVPVGGKCLHIEFGEQSQGMTWQSARDYCQALGGTEFSADLASFPTCDQYTQFARYMALNAPSNTSLWMGAHTLFSPNMWEWVTLESLQTGVPFWAYVEDFHAADDCAASDGNFYYRLVADSCDQSKGFACTYTPSVTKQVRDDPPDPDYDCPDNGIKVGEFCYVFKDHSETFEKAEQHCRDEHDVAGGELYYPDTCEEFTHIAHHLEATENIKSYWVGAIDVTGEHEWTWVNGGLVPGGPPYWATGQPSHDHESSPREHCGAMSPNERFYLKDTPCKNELPYICKFTMPEK